MTRKNTFPLDTGDMFPEIRVTELSGKTLTLPEATGDDYSVVLFYRGHW